MQCIKDLKRKRAKRSNPSTGTSELTCENSWEDCECDKEDHEDVEELRGGAFENRPIGSARFAASFVFRSFGLPEFVIVVAVKPLAEEINKQNKGGADESKIGSFNLISNY